MPIRKDVVKTLDPVKYKHVVEFFDFHAKYYAHIPRQSNLKKREVYSRFGDTAFQKILVESQPARSVLGKAQEEIAEIMRK